MIARLAVLLAVASSLAASAGATVRQPLVVVMRQGGLCMSGSVCRSTVTFTDSRISGAGYRPRRLAPAERRALVRAIGRLDRDYLRRHPFKGTCPIAYDGSEAIYRFRGFGLALPSCTYDMRRVEAVKLVERLIGSLKRA